MRYRSPALAGILFLFAALTPKGYLVRVIAAVIGLGLLDTFILALKSPESPAPARERKLGWAIAVSFLTIYGFSLNYPGFPYFDETNYRPIMDRLWSPSGFALATHPPLGYILSSLAVRVFGDHPWASRLPSFLSGLGLLWIVYRMTKILSGRPRAAFFACAVLGMDGICFVQSRIFTLNAVMLFFGLLSLLCLMEHSYDDSRARRPAFLLSGFFLGCSLATRWQSVSLLALFAVLFLNLLRKASDKKALIVDALVFWAAPCAAVYVGTFFWIFSRNAPGILPTLAGIVEWHRRIFLFQLNVGDGHPYASRWWTWPLMLRPVWYIYEEIVPDKIIRGIICIGNPAVIWMLPAAAGFMTWLALQRDRAVRGMSVFVLAGIASQWLPWAFRPGMEFIHYFYTAIPFLAMAIGVGLDRLWSSGPKGRRLALCYLGTVALMFVYWYPLLCGLPVSKGQYVQHMWFTSWI